MRIVVVGNSHIAALLWAAPEKLPALRGASITFWGMPGEGFFNVRYENGCLHAPDPKFALHVSGGRHEVVRVKDYDVLVLHGVTLNQTKLLGEFFASSEALAEYSSNFLESAALEQLNQQVAIELLKPLCAEFRGQVIASPQPLICDQSHWFGDFAVQKGAKVRMDMALSNAFSSLGMTFVAQPAETVIEDRYTASRYCLLRKVKGGKIDYNHMNGLYGAEVWAALGACLGLAQPGAPEALTLAQL